MEKSYAQYCLHVLKKEKYETAIFPDSWVIHLVGTYGYEALIDYDFLDLIYTDEYGYNFYAFKEV
jgi:hypothetical protein